MEEKAFFIRCQVLLDSYGPGLDLGSSCEMYTFKISSVPGEGLFYVEGRPFKPIRGDRVRMTLNITLGGAMVLLNPIFL